MSKDRVKEYIACTKWMRAVEDWMKADRSDPTPPPPTPVDAILAPPHGAVGASPYLLALATELRQTRAERDAAVEALVGMCRQHCRSYRENVDPSEVSGAGLHANADAIEFLADLGYIEVQGGQGGRTIWGRDSFESAKLTTGEFNEP